MMKPCGHDIAGCNKTVYSNVHGWSPFTWGDSKCRVLMSNICRAAGCSVFTFCPALRSAEMRPASQSAPPDTCQLLPGHGLSHRETEHQHRANKHLIFNATARSLCWCQSTQYYCLTLRQQTIHNKDCSSYRDDPGLRCFDGRNPALFAIK